MATEEIQNEELENEQTEEGQTAQGESESSEEDANEVVNSKEAQSEEDNARNDEEREAIRERRRQERHDKKIAQREREESMRRELASRDHQINELNQRLAAVEKRGQQTDVTQIDQAIKQSADGYNYFKEQIAIAAKNGDGATLADATEKMIVAQRRYEDLNKIKQQALQNQQKAPPLDPQVVNHAKTWLEKNKWYDPNGSDIDSEIAGTVDRRLASEGWNPRTPQYWEELDARLREQLPKRFKSATVRPNGSGRSPVAGSGRESAPSSSGSSYKLSPERVQALKDSGKWNDPKERERMIQYYKSYDKQQSAAGN